jgi:hypothetical protein
MTVNLAAIALFILTIPSSAIATSHLIHFSPFDEVTDQFLASLNSGQFLMPNDQIMADFAQEKRA